MLPSLLHAFVHRFTSDAENDIEQYLTSSVHNMFASCCSFMLPGLGFSDSSVSGLRIVGFTGLPGLGFGCSGTSVVVVVVGASVAMTTGFIGLTGVIRVLVGLDATGGPDPMSPPSVEVRWPRGILEYEAMNPSEVTLRSDTNWTRSTLPLDTMFLETRHNNKKINATIMPFVYSVKKLYILYSVLLIRTNIKCQLEKKHSKQFKEVKNMDVTD